MILLLINRQSMTKTRSSFNPLQLRFWVSVAILTMPQYALAKPEVKETREYFTVSGQTSTELYQSIRRNTPFRKGDKHFHAQTQWKVSWNYQWRSSENRCSVTSIATQVEVTIILPQLAPDAELSEAVETQWNRYLQALTDHELQHKAHGVAAAEEIEDTLSTLSNIDCFKLRSIAERKARDITEKYIDKDKAFDLATDHGAKDGIRL